MSYKPVDAAITMVVGPCIDDIDFKTLEEAIAHNAAGMDVSLIVEKTDGTTDVTAITLTTGGTSDWTHKDGGYYEIEITAAQNIEEGVGYVRGVCTGVLPFESTHYNIVKANVYDSWVKGTDVLQADITQLGGVAQSATDLKDFADAGYDPGTNKITGTADMRGTDSANTTVPDAAGVAPTAVEIRQEMDTNSTKMAPSQVLSDYKATGFSTHNAAAVKTAIEADGSSIAHILTDTGELQTDWVNGGRLDNLLDAIPTTAMRGTDNAALASGVDVTKIHGAALTETANGYLAAAFTKLFDVATPLLVASEVMRGTESAYTGTPPTVIQIRTEMDTNGTKMAPSQTLDDYKATGFNTVVPDAAGVAATPAEVATALTDINLDHLVKIAVDTNFATTVHLDSVIGQLADVGTSATYDRTTDALEAIRNVEPHGSTMVGTNGANTTVPDVAGTLASYDPPTNTEMVAAFTEIKGATWAAGSDTLEHIRNKQTDIETDTGEIGTAGAGLTDLGGMSTNMKNEVNSEASDVMTVDTTSEPPQGPPPATPTFEQIFAYMYFRMMNKNEETATEHAVYNVAGTTKVIKASVSDVAGTLTKGEFESGA